MTALSGGCPARGCTRVVLAALLLPVAVCIRSTGNSSAETQLHLDTPKAILHIVGDTHGDENYLFRALVSTGRFVVKHEADESGGFERGSLRWWPGMDDSEDFEVIILGDMADRGLKSRQNLLSLKKLAEDEKWGRRLVILMGNHEEMLLTHDLRYASGDLDETIVTKALTTTDETDEDGQLMQWLRGLPVVYLKHGVLMTHGGLAQSVLADLVQHTDACAVEGSTPSACGDALVADVNRRAKEFFLSVDSCIKGGMAEELDRCAPRPDFLGTRRGVLWYRRYSEVGAGAGTPPSCNEAHIVAEAVGAKAMAVAHTTHEYIHRLCESTPVILTDTHFQHCAEIGECDYQAQAQKTFREDVFDPRTPMTPQSLRVTAEEGDRMTYDVCLSFDRSLSSVHCLPLSS